MEIEVTDIFLGVAIFCFLVLIFAVYRLRKIVQGLKASQKPPDQKGEELSGSVGPRDYSGIRFMPMGLMPTPDEEEKKEKETETNGE